MKQNKKEQEWEKDFEKSFPNTTKFIRFNLDTNANGEPENWQEVDMGLHLEPIVYRQLKDFIWLFNKLSS